MLFYLIAQKLSGVGTKSQFGLVSGNKPFFFLFKPNEILRYRSNFVGINGGKI